MTLEPEPSSLILAFPCEQVEKVAAKLSEMFGGATATEARGYWCSQSAGLVAEGVTIVYSAATPEAVQAHAAEVVQLCQQIKQDMQQGSPCGLFLRPAI